MPNHFRAIGATTFLSPIPAVMLSCRGTEPGFDKDNLITVAWAGVINSAPPMISVSCVRRATRMRRSCNPAYSA